MHDSEQRIRERAYAIWEQEGRPDGREHAHWERARSLLETEAEARGRTGPFRGEAIPAGPAPSRPRTTVSATEAPAASGAAASQEKARAPRRAKSVSPVSPSRKKASAVSRSPSKDAATGSPE
jgi:Protein of unknown function (DUF2934)